MAATFRNSNETLRTISRLLLLFNCRFIDVPIESCGKASPLRVALQASAPDVLMILLRFGANPNPLDGGTPPVLAVMEKLMEFEESGSYPYQLVSCLKLLLLAIPFVELPYKVSNKTRTSNFIFGIFLLPSRCCSQRDVKCFTRNTRRSSSRRWFRCVEPMAYRSWNIYAGSLF